MWLERFGHDVLLSYQTEPGRDAVLADLDQRCAAYAYKPLRVFGKYLPQQASERGAPVLLRGDEAGGSLETEVSEAGARYGLDFAGGYSAGLFIDPTRQPGPPAHDETEAGCSTRSPIPVRFR